MSILESFYNKVSCVAFIDTEISAVFRFIVRSIKNNGFIVLRKPYILLFDLAYVL